MEAGRRELYHYGVSKRDGAKVGSGRYPLGSGERPRSRTVFISGSSKTQDESSEYYRKDLPKDITDQIDEHIKRHDKILVGDAPGIDRQVQNYLNDKGYSNVEIYGPGKKVRYTANEKWKTNPIDAPEFEEMSPEWLRKKDIAMTEAADEGLAVILDQGAKATRNNVDRLLEQNKNVKVYELAKDKNSDKFYEFQSNNKQSDLSNEIYNTLSDDEKKRVTARDIPPEEYTNRKEYSQFLAKSFILKVQDTPIAVFDIWREGDNDVALALMTRSEKEYRGRGYAKRVVQQGMNFIDSHKDIKTSYWDVRKDNKASIALAEKYGFVNEGEFKDNWLQYEKRKD